MIGHWSQFTDMISEYSIAGKISEDMEPKKVSKKYGVNNPDALDYYLKGNHLLRSWDMKQGQQMIEYFEKAVTLDPEFIRITGIPDITGIDSSVLRVTEKYTKSGLTTQQAKEIIRTLESFMETEKPFLNAGLAVVLTLIAVISSMSTWSGLSMIHLSEKYFSSSSEVQQTQLLAAGHALIASDMWNSAAVFIYIVSLRKIRRNRKLAAARI